MSSPRSPFGLLRTAFDAVFRQDLALRRGPGGVRVVLKRADGGAEPPPTPEELERRRQHAELRAARDELTGLLDEDHSARSTMRHLAVVEHALGRLGWQALERVPLDVLQRALEQFEERVSNWSARGLACLRSRMAVAVAERLRREGPPSGEAAAALDSPPDVARQAIDRARVTAAVAEPEVTEAGDDDEAQALLAAYGSLVEPPPGR
ncbi:MULTISPECIES: hypothetical protein [unclassified Rubrivivax]|uniref:hypothetical protein n=1 Tax=unclassified Rubrivivax TaxID=2649762 RepID=UPI001E57D796|nr:MULTISPECIES: hypothetical protein [unclassified Rubrivivax]MCC9596239.1 hypothetical protein [Rubrivivax sp. JA1055]MCC9647420.1 hypothetical protein [Rubrivivax sp. JA1029]